jgi:hypothetical protein
MNGSEERPLRFVNVDVVSAIVAKPPSSLRQCPYLASRDPLKLGAIDNLRQVLNTKACSQTPACFIVCSTDIACPGPTDHAELLNRDSLSLTSNLTQPRQTTDAPLPSLNLLPWLAHIIPEHFCSHQMPGGCTSSHQLKLSDSLFG